MVRYETVNKKGGAFSPAHLLEFIRSLDRLLSPPLHGEEVFHN